MSLRTILAHLVADCQMRRAEDIERDDLMWKDQSDLFNKAIADILALLPSEEEIAQLFLDTRMKEMQRNTGKCYHKEGYKIASGCSCGNCHMSYLQAEAIHKRLEEVFAERKPE